MLIGSASAVQVNSSTEIYSFNVTDPAANVSSLGCAAAVIHYTVNISNWIYIDQVYFTIAGTDYLASSSGSLFWYDYTKAQNLYDINTTLSWTKVKIYDISEGVAQAFINLDIPINCVTCHYTEIDGNCGINDSRLVQFIGSGIPGCDSFNVTQSCNYCSENLIENTIVACTGVYKTVSYTDGNYSVCCAVTGLDSDCDILDYPYNSTTNQSCSFYSGDFTLQCDPTPIIEDRINCLINLGGNKSYQCWSYITQSGLNGSQGNYLQVNPTKTEYQGTLLIGTIAETREYFDILRGTGNIYYTRKGIVGDTNYLLGVKCVDPDGNIKMSEQLIKPVYDNLNDVAARGVWAKRNIGPIFIIIISLLVVGGIIVSIAGILKGDWGR